MACMAGHVSPEASDGGPLALIENGDEIVVNLPAKTIDINVTDDVMATRKAAWTPHQPTYWSGAPIKRGVLHNYAQLVGCASEGANVGA